MCQNIFEKNNFIYFNNLRVSWKSVKRKKLSAPVYDYNTHLLCTITMCIHNVYKKKNNNKTTKTFSNICLAQINILRTQMATFPSFLFTNLKIWCSCLFIIITIIFFFKEHLILLHPKNKLRFFVSRLREHHSSSLAAWEGIPLL